MNNDGSAMMSGRKNGPFSRLAAQIMALMCVAVTAACTVGPDFQPPQAELPAAWSDPAVAGRPDDQADEARLADWWKLFADPQLTGLIEKSMTSNLDVLKAEARIREARAARDATAAGRVPTLDAGGSYQRSRSARSAAGGAEAVSGLYQFGFDAGWEIDLFGRQQRAIEAAAADLQASVEMRRDVLVTLTAEVASNYLTLRSLQQRLAIARDNLRAQEHSLSLTHRLFQHGFVGRLDIARAEAQAATTAAQLPGLEEAIQQTIYRIGVLLGAPPAALLPELLAAAPLAVAPPVVPFGIPADLLRRRPDIRRSAAELHAATARIGLAVADLFPRLTITGAIGVQDSGFGSTFAWRNRFWSFGPALNWRLFDYGGTRAGIEVRNALQEQSLIAYRQMILTALQEVENALIAAAKEQERHRALSRAVNANRQAVDLAMTLYAQGQSDFLAVLDAQRSLYALEDSLAQSSLTGSLHLIALYKALGGGWPETAR